MGALGALRAARGGGAACFGYWRAAAPAADFAGLEAAEPIVTLELSEICFEELFGRSGKNRGGLSWRLDCLGGDVNVQSQQTAYLVIGVAQCESTGTKG